MNKFQNNWIFDVERCFELVTFAIVLCSFLSLLDAKSMSVPASGVDINNDQQFGFLVVTCCRFPVIVLLMELFIFFLYVRVFHQDLCFFQC